MSSSSTITARRSMKDWPRGSLPLGTIRERQTGERGARVRVVKVALTGPIQDRWMHFARWWWLKNRGPIPEGKLVYHVDGNTLNDDPSNLAIGTNTDVVRAAHRSDPRMSAKNRAAMSEGCREHNRLRGRIARATRWLSWRWYPVDHEAKIIHNKPRRGRHEIWPAMGFEVPYACNGGSADSAALGWPDLPFLQAVSLMALSTGPLDGAALLPAVEVLRQRRQEPPLVCRTNLYQATGLLKRAGLITIQRRGKKPGMYRITPRALEIRTKWTPIVPVHGRLLIAGECEGYAKLDEEFGLRRPGTTGDSLIQLAHALAGAAEGDDHE